MRFRRTLWLIVLFVVPLSCADPAAEAPQAEVGEAVELVEASPADRYGDDTLVIDGSQSTIGFVGSKVTGSHAGGFRLFSGEIVLGDSVTDSSVRVVIDARSLWSDDERLTEHLKSEDFFDVVRYPRAVFESTEITAVDGGGYTVAGNLTLHGVTKQIRFPAEITREQSKVRAQAEFSIKRFDFDIVYAGRADDLIRDDVLIRLDLVTG